MLARYFITLLWAGSLAFAQTTTTPNMNLALPVVGQEIGPQWATDLNNAFTVVDQHDHTPGKGVQIPPAGLNINSALTFNDNAATNLLEVDLSNGSTPSSNDGALSVAPGGGTGIGDLYYTDFAGNQIQLTKSGQVNVVASSIPGESYSAGTFIWDQTQSSLPTTPANFDIGSITLRPNIAATTVGTTLTPPSSGNFTIGLPVPMSEGYAGVPNFVNMDNSGQQVNTYYLDNSTLNVSGNVIQVKPGGITRTQLSGSSAFLAPTLSVATASGTGSGGFGSTQQGWLVNTTTSVTAALGDTYTNNSNTYTVQAALTAQTGQDLFLSGTGAFSGTTLTRATGSGSTTITFTNATGNALNPESTYLYTTPTSPAPLYLDIQMIGGGGGGGAAGNVSWVNSTAGGSTIFGTLLALSNGGGATNGAQGGSGGTNLTTTPWTLSSLAQIIINAAGSSGSGGSGTTTGIVGGNGGTSPFGGSGGGGGDLNNGQAAIANSGSGGGGHGGDGSSSFSGAGGGSAGYLHYRINSPSSTYLYAIGVGGAFSTSGSGLHGGTGGSGVIIISEDYQ